jgi:hypothetical protein
MKCDNFMTKDIVASLQFGGDFHGAAEVATGDQTVCDPSSWVRP